MLKLSIIVPVYNVEPYIRPCIESIFNQGLNENDYEVIIVNDGSTDKSMEMVTDIITQPIISRLLTKRIKVYRLPVIMELLHQKVNTS